MILSHTIWFVYSAGPASLGWLPSAAIDPMPRQPPRRPKRSPPRPSRPGSRQEAGERTRAALLAAAFGEIHRRGFQGASIDRILDSLGLTRGALFHHFPSKRALGYAVVDEFMRPGIEQAWIAPLDGAPEPVDALLELMSAKAQGFTHEELLLGCPLNNLSQEMSPLDDGFRDRTQALFGDWRDGIRRAIVRAQEAGRLDAGIDAPSMALAVLALYEGGISLAKNAQSRQPLVAAVGAIGKLLEAPRPPSRRSSGR